MAVQPSEINVVSSESSELPGLLHYNHGYWLCSSCSVSCTAHLLHTFPPKYLEVCLTKSQTNHIEAEDVQNKEELKDQFGVQSGRNFVRT